MRELDAHLVDGQSTETQLCDCDWYVCSCDV